MKKVKFLKNYAPVMEFNPETGRNEQKKGQYIHKKDSEFEFPAYLASRLIYKEKVAVYANV